MSIDHPPREPEPFAPEPIASEPDAPPPRVSRRKLGIAGVIGLVVAGVVVVTGIMAREKSSAELRDWTDAQAMPSVAVALPDAKLLKATLDLPGRLEAYYRAPIFARVSGYLKSWSADIGAKVKAGQVIAEIEAPDLDQQLLQARADLASQQASARLSEATLNRRKTLVASNFVSAQEIDERTADLANKKAAVNSGQANVERLEALAGYKNITVPFDGVITERNTDVGALISGGAGTGPAMFVVSDIKKLRVYVNVPQSYVPAIKIGAKAALTLPDYPNRTFTATLEASSQAVDVGSGTTRMQLALDNAGGELMPGGYANVRLNLSRDGAPLHIPASALVFGAAGLRVATVGADDRVLFKQVKIARDLGRDIELAAGVAADDRIITAPPDGISDGDAVRVVSGPKPGKPATASEKQDSKG
ncbi:RND family efflux transporter MFP subunit [Rhodopseudomonas rhenobacensis]|uniref:RND family efflux transporter MFP subunit n=1 Tax=Rhodopseudomonas rhenobacensis TaxID=87461 RepID=A0A7W7Z1I6_9BRAD|nr:efflux RND transporter periplasmic adaptor subunit [Rhodopseudomonas rhenobacensis]MBB5046184.1 RND family efflux transporter MFP subunit [Rhodopseudomonas rhenobacensis]